MQTVYALLFIYYTYSLSFVELYHTQIGLSTLAYIISLCSINENNVSCEIERFSLKSYCFRPATYLDQDVPMTAVG